MLIRTARPQPRVIEMQDAGGFARAMQDSERIRRNSPMGVDQRQRVEVILQASDNNRQWFDCVPFWEGYWRSEQEGGIPVPTRADVVAAARAANARFGRYVVRSTI